MKIISGGQTGADMGALAAARELGFPTGGTAPQGWWTEEGPQEALLRSFGLRECDQPGYPARTRQNVMDSDATLLVGSCDSGGSALTYDIVKQVQKPVFRVETDSRPDIEQLRHWIERHHIRVLNVAGNRESMSPGIFEFTRQLLLETLRPWSDQS
jgi:hypothetical protein